MVYWMQTINTSSTPFRPDRRFTKFITTLDLTGDWVSHSSQLLGLTGDSPSDSIVRSMTCTQLCDIFWRTKGANEQHTAYIGRWLCIPGLLRSRSRSELLTWHPWPLTGILVTAAAPRCHCINLTSRFRQRLVQEEQVEHTPASSDIDLLHGT